MTRSSRSKSRTRKVNRLEDGVLTPRDSSQDLNGGVTVGIVDHSSEELELRKKRGARTCSSSDSNLDNNGPPNKKRLCEESSPHRLNTAIKRPLDNDDSEANNQKPTKLARLVHTNQRMWSQVSNSPNSQSLNSNCESDKPPHNFVVASYNIAEVSTLFQSCFDRNTCVSDQRLCDMHHDALMTELIFIDADIVCLQHVGVAHWSILEKSLKHNGYHGNIIVGDIAHCDGVATLYRSSRFEQLHVDQDKLSKLCYKCIPSNNFLEESTMKSIMQYIDEPEAYIVTLLKDKQHKRLLIVGNTRLSNDKTDKVDLKCMQAVGLFWRIHDMVCKIKEDNTNNNSHTGEMPSPCWILCGDFNGSVDSPVYQICRDGYPNDSTIAQLQAVKNLTIAGGNQRLSLVNLIWNSFQHPFNDSCNSYQTVTCHETGKDFIWLSENALETEKVLLGSVGCKDNNNGAGGGGSGCNNTNDSTHHLSLACDLAFMT